MIAVIVLFALALIVLAILHETHNARLTQLETDVEQVWQKIETRLASKPPVSPPPTTPQTAAKTPLM